MLLSDDLAFELERTFEYHRVAWLQVKITDSLRVALVELVVDPCGCDVQRIACKVQPKYQAERNLSFGRWPRSLDCRDGRRDGILDARGRHAP